MHRDLAHVRDIEQARRGAGVQMFGDDPAGYCSGTVAGERHHPSTQAQMERVERGSSQGDIALRHDALPAGHAGVRSLSTSLAGRLHLVEPAHRHVVRRRLDDLGIGMSLGDDLSSAAMKASSVGLLSVSVGSIISASGTMSGK